MNCKCDQNRNFQVEKKIMKTEKLSADKIVLLGMGCLAILIYLAIPLLSLSFFSSGESGVFGEFGFFESATVLFYLSSFIICVYRIITKRTNYLSLCVLWCLLSFVFFGEESSWLQHYIGYETPSSVVDHNMQEEFNFHNLYIFSKGSWHEALSSRDFDITLFLGAQNVFRLGFFSYFIVIPLLLRLFLLDQFDKIKNFRSIIPNYNLMMTIFFVMLLSFDIHIKFVNSRFKRLIVKLDSSAFNAE